MNNGLAAMRSTRQRRTPSLVHRASETTRGRARGGIDKQRYCKAGAAGAHIVTHVERAGAPDTCGEPCSAGGRQQLTRKRWVHTSVIGKLDTDDPA